MLGKSTANELTPFHGNKKKDKDVAGAELNLVERSHPDGRDVGHREERKEENVYTRTKKLINFLHITYYIYYTIFYAVQHYTVQHVFLSLFLCTCTVMFSFFPHAINPLLLLFAFFICTQNT